MKILQIIKIIKIMARFLLLSLLVLVLGFNSGCSSDGTGGAGQAGGGAAAPPPLLAIVYVDDDASDGGDGTSWTKAFKDLQAGINDAAKKAEGKNGYVRVHVAQGTYKPNDKDPTNTDRNQHFALKNNVEVYGGYKKGMDGEYRVVRLGENTPDADKTILSGDLGGDDDPNDETTKADNVYHVFYHPSMTNLTSSAKLENVTITKGNASNRSGGGMYNQGSDPKLTNVNFTSNIAGQDGGGMYNSGSSPTLNGVSFTSNKADFGGGMYNKGSSPTLTNVTFTSNTANNGGGMYNSGNSPSGNSPTLNNVTFTSNTAQYYGGGMYNKGSSPKLNDVDFTSNEANSGGGMYNWNKSNPEFLSVCTFTGNMATEADGKGGAIYNNKSSTITNPANAKDGSGKEITSITADNGKDNGYYKAP